MDKNEEGEASQAANGFQLMKQLLTLVDSKRHGTPAETELLNRSMSGFLNLPISTIGRNIEMEAQRS